jgi:hypothetical protein
MRQAADGSGFPMWLRPEDHPGGRWRRVGGVIIWDNASGPTLLPQLQCAKEPVPERFGRPPLTLTHPEYVEFAAWAHDISGDSIRRIAWLVDRGPVDRPVDAAVKQAKRDIKAGRARLCEDGVLPWAAYEEGRVEREWWESGQLVDAIQRWRVEAVRKPSPPPPEPLDLAFALAVARALTDAVHATVEPVSAARIWAFVDRFREIERGRVREIERYPWRWPA